MNAELAHDLHSKQAAATPDLRKRNSWQELLDALSEWDEVATSKLTRVKEDSVEIFMSSKKNAEVHRMHEPVLLNGSAMFCSEIVRTGSRFEVDYAASDTRWSGNPYVEKGLTAYAGVPVRSPGGSLFGTLCIYGTGPFENPKLTEKVLPGFARVIEADLRTLHFENKYERLLLEKESLVKEYHHRIKNNMSTVFGFLYLQAESVEDESTRMILDDAAMRVKSMAVLYDKLYRSESRDSLNLRDYLETLIEDILSTYHNSTAIQTSIDIDDTSLDTKVLSSVGIIINELITNSMKHAFNGRKEGEISISVKRDADDVHIKYADDGKGISDENIDKAMNTFGIQLIHLLVGQMEGQVHMDGSQGTSFDIRFNAENGEE